MARTARVVRRGPFRTRLLRYRGKAAWHFAPIPKALAPPVTRGWGRTPVRAIVDGFEWETSLWREKGTGRALLAVPRRVRGEKGDGDAVTVEFSFDPDD